MAALHLNPTSPPDTLASKQCCMPDEWVLAGASHNDHLFLSREWCILLTYRNYDVRAQKVWTVGSISG